MDFSFIIKRLIQTVFLLVLVSAITFSFVTLAPGGPSIILDPEMSEEAREAMISHLGLDQPIHVQYIRWLGQTARGNLGVSYNSGRPVNRLIINRLKNTLILSGTALLGALIIGIVLGVISAVRPYSFLDNIVTFIAFFGLSIPVFWYGLILLVIFSVNLGILPSGGMYSIGGGSLRDLLRHLVMPAIVLGTVNMAQIVRYTRSSVLNVLKQDYIRTAHSKGLKARVVLYKHALKNAIIPVITLIGLLLPRLIGGAAITEQVFAWPGMGLLIIRAVFQNDYPVMVGVTLVVSVVVLLGNLVVDLAYSYVDPRIRYD